MISKNKNNKLAKRSGGSKARHADRLKRENLPSIAPLMRVGRDAELLSEKELQFIEDKAFAILENIGIHVGENAEATSELTGAGAEFREGRIYLPSKLCRALLETVPSSFTHHARNSKRSVHLGGKTSVFASPSGASFVRELDGLRRQSTHQDLVDFVKLGQIAPALHTQSYAPCQALDLPVEDRHLETLYTHIKYSDKPMSGAVGSKREALQSIETADILFGKSFCDESQVLLGELNTQSPLRFSPNFLDVIRIYASANQACVISPLVLMGVTSPMSVMTSLAQVTAEFLAAAAFSQIIRPASPVVFGTFIAVATMQSGTLSFGSPKSSQFLQCAGQMARKLGMPFRASGGVTSSKVLDFHAAHESQNGINASLSSGANMISNGAGLLESGLVVSAEKFISDVEQLELRLRQSVGEVFSDQEDVELVLQEGLERNSYLGSFHTERNFQEYSLGSRVADNNIFEQWRVDGEKSSDERAAEIGKNWLDNYEIPPLDPDIERSLSEYLVAKKKENRELPPIKLEHFLENDCQAIAADHLHDQMWGDVFKRTED